MRTTNHYFTASFVFNYTITNEALNLHKAIGSAVGD